MGSDTAPLPEIEGVVAALKERKDIEVTLVGKQDLIEKELACFDTTGMPITIHHSPTVIDMGESPSKALKTKPEASLCQTIGLQKMGKVDASISAGNTGAFMGASLFGLGRIENVNRPAIGVTMPTVAGFSFCLDMGANSDCKPQHLFQFARMGEIFAEYVLDKKNPSIGLLSVGEEPGKGNEATVATHAMLASSLMNFAGNIEGNGVIFDKADVIVCDGFVGNILLKFYESIPHFIYTTVGDLFVGERAQNFLEKFNKDTYGAADLLGVNGVVLICHGSSSATAIKNAVLKAEKMVLKKVNERIRQVMLKDPQCFE